MKKRHISLDLSNPCLVYGIIWIAALWLVNLQFVSFFIKPNEKTIILVVSNIISFVLVYFILSINFPKIKKMELQAIIRHDILDKLWVFTKKLLFIWILGSIVEILVSGGLPIYWALTNASKGYADFGIPTFHGLMNALHMFCTMSVFLDYCLRKNKRKLLLVMGLLIWPVIGMSRGALVWPLLEIFGIYLLLNKVSIANILKIITTLVLFIVLFGYIGDYRQGIDIYDYESSIITKVASEEGINYFKYLPSGVFWFYLYGVSGINNVIGVINNLEPTYSIYPILGTLLPSIIRDNISGPSVSSWELVSQAFTASTYYSGLLVGSGIMGAILIVIILQFIIVYFYINARRGSVWAILCYGILFQSLVLSIFWDTFFSLVTIAQILLALYFRKICSKVNVVNPLRDCA